MCFYTKGNKLKIATKDIKSYKLVEIKPNFCISADQQFKYEYNKKYSNKSKLIFFFKWLFNKPIKEEGYHSFNFEVNINIKDVIPDASMIECIIPKGSLYLEDEKNVRCSTSIIIKKE